MTARRTFFFGGGVMYCACSCDGTKTKQVRRHAPQPAHRAGAVARHRGAARRRRRLPVPRHSRGGGGARGGTGQSRQQRQQQQQQQQQQKRADVTGDKVMRDDDDGDYWGGEGGGAEFPVVPHHCFPFKECRKPEEWVYFCLWLLLLV